MRRLASSSRSEVITPFSTPAFMNPKSSSRSLKKRKASQPAAIAAGT